MTVGWAHILGIDAVYDSSCDMRRALFFLCGYFRLPYCQKCNMISGPEKTTTSSRHNRGSPCGAHSFRATHKNLIVLNAIVYTFRQFVFFSFFLLFGSILRVVAICNVVDGITMENNFIGGAFQWLPFPRSCGAAHCCARPKSFKVCFWLHVIYHTDGVCARSITLDLF